MAKAPTFFSWSRDKPCTTNAVYGWTLRTTAGGGGATERKMNLTQSKQNLTDSHDLRMTRSKTDTRGFQRKEKSCEICRLPSNVNKYNINSGYVTGYVPVSEKTARNITTNENTVQRSNDLSNQSKNGSRKYLCLWHSLSGTLVHCPDYSIKAS